MIEAARFQLLCGRLHELGPRATYELMRELADGADLLERLEVYAQLDPEIVRALGADTMPIDRIKIFRGGRR